MSNVSLTKSNCATLNYFTKGKKHDPVKHLGLRLSDWTKRFKSLTTKGKKHDQVNYIKEKPAHVHLHLPKPAYSRVE